MQNKFILHLQYTIKFNIFFTYHFSVKFSLPILPQWIPYVIYNKKFSFYFLGFFFPLLPSPLHMILTKQPSTPHLNSQHEKIKNFFTFNVSYDLFNFSWLSWNFFRVQQLEVLKSEVSKNNFKIYKTQKKKEIWVFLKRNLKLFSACEGDSNW